MTPQLSWVREGERLVLQGELDLHAVSRVDTAGVALLIHLIAQGKIQGHQVSLEGISENLQTLAALYNLPADVLPR